MKKKIIFDLLLNIVATAIPIAIIQLLIYPIIAKELGNTDYGLMITLVSLFNLVSHPYGNVLNNIRLLQNNDYEKNNFEGDFNILLIVGLFFNSIIMIIGTIYYEGGFSFVSILLSIAISALILIREYMIVTFRISLNYKAILLNNIFLVFGYLVGFLLFIIFGYWQLIYLSGYFVSLLFILKNSDMLKEKYKITPLFNSTSHKSMILFFSTFLKSAIVYADKLIIYPLLGPVAVSTYYSATILGKIISMGIAPISSVFLSYLPNIKKISLYNFIRLLFITGVIGVVGYYLCILVSKPMLFLLYPEWAIESLDLIKITTASAILGVMCSVINPVILRFNNVNWQLVISMVEVMFYVVFTIFFYRIFGLKGFCLGILITKIFKLLLMITVYISYLRRNKLQS
ncbi:hypothetical protein [Sedimentibacter sp. MB31-C6]|uniref:hypothetical protein n=1 Tax=Sedimentibacter sp. MB31-C6 TaxID=3109366 RepID=UPI002DDD9E75|nr:hypothetical protein [Sedimentibacter sp. MB36-C1]WSI03567.1 hypothetical protein U8307_10965 [Sedimentibacter sp. MB36-C1]